MLSVTTRGADSGSWYTPTPRTGRSRTIRMKYFWLTMKHKWFVLLAGCRVGAPLWRLLLHDLSKLLPAELPHYQRQFFGRADDPAGFIGCWLHHQNRNAHHWEYWIPRTGHHRCNPAYPDMKPLPMPMWAVKEMIADWLAAGRAYEGRWPDLTNWTWLEKSWNRMQLHKDTQIRIAEVLICRLNMLELPACMTTRWG